MSDRARLIRLMLAGAGLSALLLPAIGLAAEPQTITHVAITPAGTPPETTTQAVTPSSTAGEAGEAPAASAGSNPPVSAPPSAATPQVAGQVAQEGSVGVGAQPSRSAGGSGRNGGAQSSSGSSTEGAPPTGPRAPSPLTLTPALPLDFSTSLSGIPSFFIESFRIPPFLLPIYQAAGSAYGVPWQVLAAINEVETDYGRDLSVSSAGAEGWMQFLPSSWAIYGVDVNGDGFKDPYNPADAIFAAARYLRAAGAATNLTGAIYAYNHSDAYVETVMLRAKLLGGTPSELLGALTGLTESRFPVHAPSHFSDGFPTVQSSTTGAPTKIAGTTIYSEPQAPVIAVQDGEVVQIGDSPELGRFIALRDAFGNTYVYAQLGSVATLYPVLKLRDSAVVNPPSPEASEPEPHPTGPASAGTHPEAAPAGAEGIGDSSSGLGAGAGIGSQPPVAAPTPAVPAPTAATPTAATPTVTTVTTGATPSASTPSGPTSSTSSAPLASIAPATTSSPRVFSAGPDEVYLHPLRVGVTVIAGTVLGHVGTGTGAGLDGAGTAAGTTEAGEPHMLFQIRPAGVGAPLIDPKPILDGWVALENTSIFRADGRRPFLTTQPTAGQVLLESKEQLERQVLDNSAIDIYPCGRADIQTGRIDRRVLATLEFLAVSGLEPTVTALACGHSDATAAPGASAYASGDAVDIAAINGIPIAGHQGPGSITDATIRRLLSLQGSMRPSEIISLMSYPGIENTLAQADHYDRIEISFASPSSPGAHAADAFAPAITPSEWIKLIARLGEIPNPTVASQPSAASIPDDPGSAAASGREARGNG